MGASVPINCNSIMKPSFYAVRVGRVPGIYESWRDAQMQVKGFAGAHHQKFDNLEHAEDFLRAIEHANSNADRAPVIQPVHSPDSIIVYTDGSCLNNGKENAMASYGVWFGDDNPLNRNGRVPGNQTNQRAELYAILSALRILKINGLLHRVQIFTDSAYACKSIKSASTWAKRGWTTQCGTPISNVELIRCISSLSSRFNFVDLVHVRGHIGIIGNEKADALANAVWKGK